MLKKNGSESENIHFSDHVIKINRRKKNQVRFLLITDAALYNLLASNFSKCKRRIPIEKVASMTISKLSDEFVCHVLDEYDYRFKSNKKETIKQILSELYYKETHKKLNVRYKTLNTLQEACLTRKQWRMQSREDKLKRREQLLEISENDSDKEEAEKKLSTTNILEPTKKISTEDFTLLKVIGRGSFGKVLQVKKNDTGKIYAMKIIRKNIIVSKRHIEHTKAERTILECVKHPFLMKLRFAFQTEQKLYIVLDFYKGGELFFHLKKNNFNEEESRFIVAETLLAIGHLHKNGVFYRDLKPENILLDESGHICLTDFGLSILFDDVEDQEAFTFCGTPEYLAPEIIQRKSYSKAVDWWSLGILLFELLEGNPPFNSRDVTEMYKMIQTSEPCYSKSMSNECKDLLQKLLKKNPTQRLGYGARDSEEIMAHPFFDSIDWDLLLEKKVKPPYQPKTKSNETDVTNFDKDFTSEAVADSYAPNEMKELDNQFKGFSYNDFDA